MTVADVETRSFPRPVLLLVGMAAGLLVVSGLRNLSDIIGPAFLALVLTIAAQPLRDWAVRMGLPQWVGGAYCWACWTNWKKPVMLHSG